MSKSPDVSNLLPLTTNVLDPLYWQPTRLGVDSDWLGHVPFGHWLVSTHRPARIVELGTRSGVSLAAFCEAILRCRITASALACDTRCNGDGPESETIKSEIADLGQFLDRHYAAVSTLMRCTSDRALELVPNESVDLLHIHATRQATDICELFSKWTHKLSSRAIVLVHQTNMRENAYEVWRFWTDVSAHYPHFEFLHGGGLGVLVFGKAAGRAIIDLCNLGDDDAASVVRQRFSILGYHWVALRDLDRNKSIVATLQSDNFELASALAEPGAQAGNAENDISPSSLQLHAPSALQARLAELHADLAARDAQIATLTIDGDAYAAQSRALLAEVDRLTSCVDVMQGEINEFSQELTAVEHQRAAILNSTSWKATKPLRYFAAKIGRLTK